MPFPGSVRSNSTVIQAAVTPSTVRKRRRVEKFARQVYVRMVWPLVKDPLKRQRIKLVWFGLGYWRLLRIRSLGMVERLKLIAKFIRVAWHVLHAHRPSKITAVCNKLRERRAVAGEVVLEAGCWKGGSTAKLSSISKLLGYRMKIYDSFEGVECLSQIEQAEEWDYGGQYASPESLLRSNLTRYGEAGICLIYKGWFSETLAACPVQDPIRLAYIDCDLARAT